MRSHAFRASVLWIKLPRGWDKYLREPRGAELFASVDPVFRQAVRRFAAQAKYFARFACVFLAKRLHECHFAGPILQSAHRW